MNPFGSARACSRFCTLACAALLTGCGTELQPQPTLPIPRFIAFDHRGQLLAQQRFGVAPWKFDPDSGLAVVLGLKSSVLPGRPVVDGMVLTKYAVVRQDAVYKTAMSNLGLRLTFQNVSHSKWPDRLRIKFQGKEIEALRFDPDSRIYLAGEFFPEPKPQQVLPLGSWRWFSVSPSNSADIEPSINFPNNLVCAEHFVRKGKWVGSALAFQQGGTDLGDLMLRKRLAKDGSDVASYPITEPH